MADAVCVYTIRNRQGNQDEKYPSCDAEARRHCSANLVPSVGIV